MKKGWLSAIGIAALLLASCGGGSGQDTTAATKAETTTETTTETTAESTASTTPAPPKQVAAKHHKKKPELPHLALTLAGHEDPESAGLVVADRNGYFVDEGLDVDVLVPAVPSYSINYVLKEVDDLGVVPLPQLVLAKEKGFPIV
ncbi:MAG TPA: ABC transporter substrate-binding protein, partial [Solirubrobacterales bacterium]|nr:ABC transporter substrate-binding protein [Solirubrobacterales bacterium]